MARKVEVKLLDDIDATEADETLTFGLDGAQYEIDLSDKNATRLREALTKYVSHARKVGRGAIAGSRRSGGSAAASRSTRAHNQAIRGWARRNGVELADRGRIPHDIVERYEADKNVSPSPTPGTSPVAEVKVAKTRSKRGAGAVVDKPFSHA